MVFFWIGLTHDGKGRPYRWSHANSGFSALPSDKFPGVTIEKENSRYFGMMTGRSSDSNADLSVIRGRIKRQYGMRGRPNFGVPSGSVAFEGDNVINFGPGSSADSNADSKPDSGSRSQNVKREAFVCRRSDSIEDLLQED